MVAQLFNTCHGLEFESERKRMSLVDISALNIDDAGDSRWDSFFFVFCNRGFRCYTLYMHVYMYVYMYVYICASIYLDVSVHSICVHM